jgi:F-type H+-transporting ATPase subunit alpha
LLERACRLNEAHGGGSITALPIIETQANDVSAYIPTNVISITDGQIYLESDLFNAGIRPAINVGRSVSRVGSAAQLKSMKQVAGQMRLDLAQYRELAAFAQFSSDLDAKTKKQLDRGERMTELLKQHWENPMNVVDQVLVIWAGGNGHVDSVKIEFLKVWEEKFLNYMHAEHTDVITTITSEKKISDEVFTQLQNAVETFNQNHPEWMIATEE